MQPQSLLAGISCNVAASPVAADFRRRYTPRLCISTPCIRQRPFRPAVRIWRCGAAGGDEAATDKAARAKQLDALRQSLLTADLNAMLMPQLKTVCREVGIAVKGRDKRKAELVDELRSWLYPDGQELPESRATFHVGRMTIDELRQALRSRGLSARGSRADLAAKMGALLVKESGDAWQPGAEWSAEGPQAGGADVGSWEGLGDSRDGSGAAAPNVAGGDPSTLYQGMLPADMTVRQLRLALRDAGLATSGNKLELIARLERHLTSPPPSLETTSAEEMELWGELSERYKDQLVGTSDPSEAAANALTEMPKRFLQNQAARMGLDSEGLKAQLVERLETHLVDQMGPEGLLTLGPGSLPPPPDPVADDLPQMPLAPPVASAEPRVTVAVVAGGGVSPDTPLESARTVITHLHTAPRRAPAGAEGGGAEAATGVAVEVFYVDAGGSAFHVPHQRLLCATVVDLDFALADAMPLESLEALVDRLRESADIVFPTAPDVGGVPGELQRLLEAAGVPFVGAGSEAIALAYDRLASTERMAALGFPVLPMLALSAEDFPTDPQTLFDRAAEALEKKGAEEEEAAAAGAAAAAAEGAVEAAGAEPLGAAVGSEAAAAAGGVAAGEGGAAPPGPAASLSGAGAGGGALGTDPDPSSKPAEGQDEEDSSSAAARTAGVASSSGRSADGTLAGTAGGPGAEGSPEVSSKGPTKALQEGPKGWAADQQWTLMAGEQVAQHEQML